MVQFVARALRPAAPFLLGAVFGAVALGALAQPAWAQAGAVTGTVVDAKTARPLADAVVVVEGSTAGARTGLRGDFRLTGLTGATARIRVTHIGYQPHTQEVPVGGQP